VNKGIHPQNKVTYTTHALRWG